MTGQQENMSGRVIMLDAYLSWISLNATVGGMAAGIGCLLEGGTSANHRYERRIDSLPKVVTYTIDFGALVVTSVGCVAGGAAAAGLMAATVPVSLPLYHYYNNDVAKFLSNVKA